MTAQPQIPDEKRRSRIDAKPDKNLLASLKRGDPSAIRAALSMGNAAALAAVEEAIAVKSGNPSIEFYRVGGQYVRTPADRQDAFTKLMLMAGGNGLITDPAYTQSFIAKLGEDQNQVFIHLMQGDPQAIFNYQLLGIQMQLGVIVGDTEQIAKSIRSKKIFLTVGITLLVMAVIGIIGSLITNANKSDLSKKASLTLNQVNWNAWEKLQYSNSVGFPEDPPADGYVYILVEVTIRNKASEEILLYEITDEDTIYLKDSVGNTYNGDSVYFYGDRLSYLPPIQNSIFHYYFQVPEDADIVEFVAYGMSADPGEKVIFPMP